VGKSLNPNFNFETTATSILKQLPHFGHSVLQFLKNRLCNYRDLQLIQFFNFEQHIIYVPYVKRIKRMQP